MGVVVAHQLPYPVWLACYHRGLRPCALLLGREVVMSLYGEAAIPSHAASLLEISTSMTNNFCH